MSLLADLRILYHVIFTSGRGADHGARLEAFYRGQAGTYDDFRPRLLHGRADLMQALDLPQGARLLDLGGGTGSNLEYLAGRWDRLSEVTIVDLCPALLQVAEQRVAARGWRNVRCIHANVTTFDPKDGAYDGATFSYSLSMIPDWFRAVDRAWALLRPGGLIGVVDFYVARKWPAAGLHRHAGWQRWFWPWWFSWDNVFLSPDVLPYLQCRFQTVRLEERFGPMPYMLGLKAPYYLFIGRKE